MRLTLTSPPKACAAVAVLGLAFGVPFVVGVASILGPPVRHGPAEWVAVATLDSLSADGVPRKVPIFVPQFDAWTRSPDELSGYIFLRRRDKSSRVVGLRATNHAGCIVDFNVERRVFEDPCWDGRWDIEGRRLHSTPEWEDLRRVRIALRGELVYVNLADAA